MSAEPWSRSTGAVIEASCSCGMRTRCEPQRRRCLKSCEEWPLPSCGTKKSQFMEKQASERTHNGI